MSDFVDPIDGSPWGSPVPGILQARTLEWVAISISNAWKWKVKVKSLGHFQLLATPWTAAYQAPSSMGFSRQEYWSGVPSPSPEEISRLPHSIVFLYFFALKSEEGFLISPCFLLSPSIVYWVVKWRDRWLEKYSFRETGKQELTLCKKQQLLLWFSSFLGLTWIKVWTLDAFQQHASMGS